MPLAAAPTCVLPSWVSTVLVDTAAAVFQQRLNQHVAPCPHFVVVKEGLDLAAEGADLILVHSDGLWQVASGWWQGIRVCGGLDRGLQQSKSRHELMQLLIYIHGLLQQAFVARTGLAASASAMWF